MTTHLIYENNLNPMDVLEKLQLENTELKADLVKTREILKAMAASVGMVNTDGTINENIKIKHIVGELTGIMMSAMSPFGDKQELEERFAFLKDILPIYEKYKNL